ncbi:hypothetical protein ACP70R_041042 [Stipagrostis hirtigluma subsp. patula]
MRSSNKPHEEDQRQQAMAAADDDYAAADEDYDAAAALAVFPDSGTGGVRDLVESGVTTVPLMYRRPTTPPSSATTTYALAIPSIDLSLPRSETVALVRAAAHSCGFFQVTNHGVPAGTIDSALSAARAFHEQSLAARSALAPSSAATYCTIPIPPPQPGQRATMPLLPWRDSLILRFDDPAAELGLDRLPAPCRDALLEYRRSATAFGMEIAGLLSEALGVGAERLERVMQVQGSPLACHYYPPCPEPARVVGGREHTDACLFTLLAQDGVGGLQIRLDDGHGGDGEWVDVTPMAGALLVNVGDVLQVVSNDYYKSVEHRVEIKSTQDARVSIAFFFNPAREDESYWFGPLPELVTAETPARFQTLTLPELINYKRKLGHARPTLDRFRVREKKEAEKPRRGARTLRKVAADLYHSAKRWACMIR